MKKIILQLKEPEGSSCTLTSRVTGKHLWPQRNFQKVIRHKHSPLGVLKFSFHTETFVSTEETLSDVQFTHLHSHHRSPKQVISLSFIGVLAKIPSRIMSFSDEKQKAKNKQIYINLSDLTDRTGHWIENQSEILKKVLCFQSETDKEKVHTLVCADAWAQNF